MAFSRYRSTPLINYARQYGTPAAIQTIREGVSTGLIRTRQMLLRGSERLDTLAGSIYGDSRYWWILAAASNIGWGMQVPPGTIINIPELYDINPLV